MSVAAIAVIAAQNAALPGAAAGVAPQADASAIASMTQLLGPQHANVIGEGLFDRLVRSLGEIDGGLEKSGRAATELALGQTDNLHQVMISGERTRLQFELAMSMRNRVLEAYQEIMRMQV